MKYCQRCCHTLADNAMSCPKCGYPCDNAHPSLIASGAQKPSYIREPNTNIAVQDKKSIGYGILAYCFWLVGFILYLSWYKKYPRRTKSILIGLLVGISVTLLLCVCVLIGYALEFQIVFD